MTQQMERVVSVRKGWTGDLPPDTDEGNVLGLLIGIAALIVVSAVFHIGGAVLVITAILAMIMLHEFGHFITARWAGMKVTDFFVGFGPTLWSVKRGDTRYGVKALPIGGFVRVIGMNNLEEVAPEDEPYTYRAQRYWHRVRFASAGTFMHFLIAYLLMIVLLAGFGRVLESTPTSTTIEDVASSLSDGQPSPAAQAGLKAGDKIVAVDGRPVHLFRELRPSIEHSSGARINLTVDRGGERFTVPVTPVLTRSEFDKAHGLPASGKIGIQALTPTTKVSLPVAAWQAGFEVRNITWQSARALVGLFSKSSLQSYSKQLTKTGPANPDAEGNRLLSPVGLGRVANSAAAAGMESVLSLLVAINIFVGMFNMLPLPPFDGGHVAVATYEELRSRISGRRHMVDMRKMLPLAYAVILALFVLSATALWLDIRHPFNLG
jgi:membrane-associated protease RseP (regulator of RpoE activity)